MRSGLAFVGFKVLPLVAVFAVAGELWPAVNHWLLTSPALAVRQVLVSGNEYLTPTEVVDLAHVKPGMPLMLLRPGAVEGRLKLESAGGRRAGEFRLSPRRAGSRHGAQGGGPDRGRGNPRDFP